MCYGMLDVMTADVGCEMHLITSQYVSASSDMYSLQWQGI